MVDNLLDGVYNVVGSGSYLELLTRVQEEMSKSIKELNIDAMSKQDEFFFKRNIENTITTLGLTCSEAKTLSELVDRVFNSMARYDILTDYLDPKVYMALGIEEIYGRWDSVRIKCKDGKILLKEKFPSPKVADDIFRRIALKFNGSLSTAEPLQLGELSANIRASFAIAPISSEKYGGEFNIRIVHGSKMTRELLVGNGTISTEGLDFLELCIKHKIGICVSGSTGSGKTGTMYHLLSEVTRDATYRVGTIEIESREFDLNRYDEDGHSMNDVFNWVTRPSDNERQNITANHLLQSILRFTPDIIGMGEMRDDEAAIACEAGATGHGMITTTHAESAEDTPLRLFTLCKKSQNNFDDQTVFTMIAQAFPIIVYQKKELDGRTRRIYEIAEFEGYKDHQLVIRNIFEFVVADNLTEERKVLGAFKQVDVISTKLQRKLLKNGAPLAEINKYSGGIDIG